MQGGPRDALVVIDEQTVGSLDMVASRGVALPPGRHFVTVQRTGYFPYDRILEVHLGEPPIRLDVTLLPVPE